MMRVTASTGAKQANAENTMTATVLAARISVTRLCEKASSSVLICLYCLKEIMKIHACEISMIPLGSKTLTVMRVKKWGIMGCKSLSFGIKLFRRQPYISCRSGRASFPIISLIMFGKKPSTMPMIHRTVIVMRVRFVVTNTGYLLRDGARTMREVKHTLF